MAGVDADRFPRTVCGLQLRIWLIAVVTLVIGLAIGLAPSIVSGRLKVDWSWNGWPVVIALATLVGILATTIATTALAMSTRRLAKATVKSVDLQHREFEAAQVAAWPELGPTVHFGDWQNAALKASVDYLHGSQPAYDVELLVRRTDMLCGGEFGTLTPMHSHAEGTFGELPDHVQWPARITQVTLAEREFQWAVTWTRTDGQPAVMCWVRRSDGRDHWVCGSRKLRSTPQELLCQ